jgi:hypothetical protein
MFVKGFRDRFPELARSYGLIVSPDGLQTLRLQITGVETICPGRCVHRVQLSAVLLDSGGKAMWVLGAHVGQAMRYQTISGEMFDVIALEILDAMKKDGLTSK